MRRGLLAGCIALIVVMAMAGQSQAAMPSAGSTDSPGSASTPTSRVKDRVPPPVSKRQAAVEEATARARETGEDAVVRGSTSADTIMFMQPDGKMRTESSAGR